MRNAPALRPPWEAVLAVALVSFSILASEVALTRIFSVLFRAPYVFLIVSGAIGGLGLGGIVIQFLRPREERLRDWIAGLAVVLAAALAAPVLLLFASPWGRELVAHAETAVVVALPMLTFCVAGMLLSLIFRAYASSGGFLYFVDLAAAAVAAPVTVFLLDRLGGLDTPLVLACAAAAAGLVVAVGSRKRGWAVAAGVVLVALGGVAISNARQPWITLPVLSPPDAAQSDPNHPWHIITKPLFVELADPVSGSTIVRTDWTAVSRTDVVRDPSAAFYYIYTDGDVPTQMDSWDGRMESARAAYGRFIGTLPYHLFSRAPDSVMAIGAGGGLDVLLALAGGAKRVDAVEINPSIPKIIADPRFQDTYARVYREPGVRLVVDEGRSFLQRAGKYDLIYFACAKTATTQTSGVALLDNHLYTVEAFRDYWRHLTDDGMVALVTQEPFLIDRLLITAALGISQEGVGTAGAGLYLITARVPQAMFGMGPYRHILLMRRRPWLAEEMPHVRTVIERTGLEPLFLPHVQPMGAGGKRLEPAADLKSLQQQLESQWPIPGSSGAFANLSPVTDDSPFYVDIARVLHPSVVGLLWGAGIATLGVVGLVLGFGLRSLGAAGGPGRVGAVVVYFMMLGAGFMLVELALMQRFILLLGFPTRSLTVTLSALLISGAMGSIVSQRGTPEEAAARSSRALPVLMALLALYALALPPVLERLLPFPLAVRAGATALFLVPAGFLMGMPFPTMLRRLRGPWEALVPAFWSVNGVTSILGSVLTMVLAKFAGYTAALLAGAACYFIAWTVARNLRLEYDPHLEPASPAAQG